jgi:hypothetical protein
MACRSGISQSHRQLLQLLLGHPAMLAEMLNLLIVPPVVFKTDWSVHAGFSFTDSCIGLTGTYVRCLAACGNCSCAAPYSGAGGLA